jgi:hypothetical protein
MSAVLYDRNKAERMVRNSHNVLVKLSICFLNLGLALSLSADPEDRDTWELRPHKTSALCLFCPSPYLGPLCALKMPKDIPGFYFDESKNRYFPSSSKPDRKAHIAEPPSAAAHSQISEASFPPSTPPPPRRRQFPDVWHALQLERLASCPRRRIAVIQSVLPHQ